MRVVWDSARVILREQERSLLANVHTRTHRDHDLQELFSLGNIFCPRIIRLVYPHLDRRTGYVNVLRECRDIAKDLTLGSIPEANGGAVGDIVIRGPARVCFSHRHTLKIEHESAYHDAGADQRERCIDRFEDALYIVYDLPHVCTRKDRHVTFTFCKA